MEYREELKFFCSDYELEILKHRLRAILPYDAHQTDDCYMIRSLYFDTADNQCFYENAAGVDDRKKYRIRTYNNSTEKIQFEIKEKLHSKTKKTAYAMSLDECMLFIQEHHSPQISDSPVLNQILMEEQMHLLRPAVIVEYERTAFTYPIGNVRITFDRNISAIPDVTDFFSEHPLKYPVLPAHQHVLEVKYDELLPDFIAQTLELETLSQTACSKYFLCRQASDMTDTL